MQSFLRKNFLSIILFGCLGVLLFVPNTKAYLLKGLLHTGLFNARTAKETSGIRLTDVSGISFTDINGNRMSLVDLKGKVVFINCWATWCPPCIAEMGSVNALYNKLKADNRFVFILADADNNLPLSTLFMRKHGYSLPVYQPASALPGELFSGTLPTTIIIDSNGQPVYKHEGVADYDTDKMIAFLRSL